MKNIAAEISTIVAPVTVFKQYDKIRPDIPENTAISIENKWYCLIFFEILRAAAAGNTNSELIINNPTQLTVKVTTTAIVQVNNISINKVFMPLLLAKEVFKLVIRSLLNITIHNINTAIKTINSNIISDLFILNKSPTK